MNAIYDKALVGHYGLFYCAHDFTQLPPGRPAGQKQPPPLMLDNPKLPGVKLAIKLTHDDDGKPLLFVESGGYFSIPPDVISQLEQVQVHFSGATENDMSTRFVLHAMLGR